MKPFQSQCTLLKTSSALCPISLTLLACALHIPRAPVPPCMPSVPTPLLFRAQVSPPCTVSTHHTCPYNLRFTHTHPVCIQPSPHSHPFCTSPALSFHTRVFIPFQLTSPTPQVLCFYCNAHSYLIHCMQCPAQSPPIRECT